MSMKTKINNIRYKLVATVIIATVLSVFSSCKREDFILPDHNAMDERIWQEDGSIQLFLNGAYSVIMPDFPYEATGSYTPWFFWASDENILGATGDNQMKKVLGIGQTLVSNDLRYIAERVQGSKGNNKYFDIARCNLAIANIPSSPISDLSKRKFLGQFHALRAMVYFNLVITYGGVPLVLEPVKLDDLNLGGRASARECFTQIVKDLDSAIVKLDGIPYTDAADRGKWTKYAAAAYKAKVLLYWASPQFNPVNDPAHPYEPERWNVALQANKEAYDLCVAAGRNLSLPYKDIFLKEGTANPEAIIVRSYSKAFDKRFQGVEARSRPAGATTGGSPSDGYVPTTKMLNSYLMKDGTRAQAGNPLYDDVLFWQNRDPRFEATIAYNGSTWNLNGKLGTKQWTYSNEVEGSTKPFYCKRFSDVTLAPGSVGIANDKGGNGLDWIELRFAEVVMNYAECLNEASQGSLAQAKDMVRQIRVRAGIPVGTNDHGLALATTKDQMRELIMNERMIEFAFEGKRGHDLRRTRRMHLLSGEFLTTPVTQVRDAAKKTKLEAINPANGLRNRDTLDINKKSTYLFYFNPTAARLGDASNAISVPETYYFYGLHNAFLQSSPFLEQTIGWDNGIFDPLK
jgi:starch-binding outer membrane protein, SusD/RagB family